MHGDPSTRTCDMASASASTGVHDVAENNAQRRERAAIAAQACQTCRSRFSSPVSYDVIIMIMMMMIMMMI